MVAGPDFVRLLRERQEGNVGEIANGLLLEDNQIIYRGWFILGNCSHSPYWINTFDLCRKLAMPIAMVIKEVTRLDDSVFVAIPWAQETASFSFYLADKIRNCFDFRAGHGSAYQDRLDRLIDEHRVDNVTVFGDLAVLGNLYVRAVDMLQQANVTVNRVVIVVSRPSEILSQSVSIATRRRVPWTSLLEFGPGDNNDFWVMKDLFGNEYARLPAQLLSAAQ